MPLNTSMSHTTPYKLIACDIDGTIMDDNFNISEELIKLIPQIYHLGYKITLISARIPLSVLYIAQQLNIVDSVIALNGSIIINSKKQIEYSQTFALARVQVALQTLSHDISRNYYHQLEWYLEYSNVWTKNEIYHYANIMQPNMLPPPPNVNKITLIGAHELLLQVQQKINQDNTVLAVFSHTNYLEISCKNISKMQGLKYYANSLNIKDEEIIAFGNGENDISMLSNVGHGVAMDNADDHIKSVAKDIAMNNNQHGVARYLKSLLHLN